MFEGPSMSYYESEADYEAGGDYIHVDEAIARDEIADDIFTLQQIIFDENGVNVDRLVKQLYILSETVDIEPSPNMRSFVQSGDLMKFGADLAKLQHKINQAEKI